MWCPYVQCPDMVLLSDTIFANFMVALLVLSIKFSSSNFTYVLQLYHRCVVIDMKMHSAINLLPYMRVNDCYEWFVILLLRFTCVLMKCILVRKQWFDCYIKSKFIKKIFAWKQFRMDYWNQWIMQKSLLLIFDGKVSDEQ